MSTATRAMMIDVDTSFFNTTSSSEFDNQKISLAPNPTTGFIYINLPSSYLNSLFDLEIHNLSGQLIYKDRTVRIGALDFKRIDLTPHPSGIYFISFKNETYNRVYKVLKQWY